MKLNTQRYSQFIVVGDTHGGWLQLQAKIERLDITDTLFICVGDIAAGFPGKYMDLQYYEGWDKWFAHRNCAFWSIRGNHDDPDWFDGRVDLPNLKLLPDHSCFELPDGRKVYCVGGGVSIDRKYRGLGLTYWPEEKFVFDPIKARKCDVLITHSGPAWIGPTDKAGIIYWCKQDETLWEELQEERKGHNALFKACQPSRWLLGHFHMYCQTEHNGCLTTILDELQFVTL